MKDKLSDTRLTVEQTMKNVRRRLKDPLVRQFQDQLFKSLEERDKRYEALRQQSVDEFDLQYPEEKPKKKKDNKNIKADKVIARSTSLIDGREFQNEWRGHVC